MPTEMHFFPTTQFLIHIQKTCGVPHHRFPLVSPLEPSSKGNNRKEAVFRSIQSLRTIRWYILFQWVHLNKQLKSSARVWRVHKFRPITYKTHKSNCHSFSYLQCILFSMQLPELEKRDLHSWEISYDPLPPTIWRDRGNRCSEDIFSSLYYFKRQ